MVYYTPFIDTVDTLNKIRYQHLGPDLPWEFKDVIGKTWLLHKHGKLEETRPFWRSTPLLQAKPALRQSNRRFSKWFRSHHIYQPIAFYQPNREPSVQGSEVLQGAKISQWQVSRIRWLQSSKVPRFQSSKLPRFWGSRFPGFKVPRIREGPKLVRGLVFVHQERNDQRNAKQTQYTIELL